MPSQLGYWAIRGLAQPLRLLLNYVGEDFEDVKYTAGGPPDYNRDEWMNVKFTFGMDFPNLPYYIDGDLKITQTNAIFSYLGRKYNLDGDSVKDKAHNDMMLAVIMDVRNGFVALAYGRDYSEQKKNTYIENAKKKLADLEKYLGDKKFFIGDKVATCDFHIYEMLDQHTVLEPTILDGMPKLKEYMERFQSLPAIKTYMESAKFMKAPLNNTMANF